MSIKRVACTIGISLAVGTGLGLGLGTAIGAYGKPFALEVDTPAGSFVFKGNLVNGENVLPPSPKQQKEQLMWWHNYTA